MPNVYVVPVMNGHPRDQAKVSVHCRCRGTDGHIEMSRAVKKRGRTLQVAAHDGGRPRQVLLI